MVVRTTTFTFLLWQLSQVLRFNFAGIDFAIPGYMVYVAVAYCALSLTITHWVGKQMIGLAMNRQGAEADFRFRATQVRENAEQIAFYQGGEEELKSLRARFELVRANFKSIIIRNFKIGLTTTTYGKFFDPLPTVAALPLYFSGQITMGGITMLSGAYSALVSTLDFFSQAYVGFAEWLAIGNRLRDFLWAIEKAQGREQGFELRSSGGDDLKASALTLNSPMGEPLTHIPALSIKPGERVLVRGPSGTGKSTLLRLKGTSFSELVWDQRLGKAREWLSASDPRDISISEIAYGVGFKSPAHFSRMFKRVFKVNPREFRGEACDTGADAVEAGFGEFAAGSALLQ